MPELPDITLYVERLSALCGGAVLEDVRLASPFVLRSVEPPLAAVTGRELAAVRNLGKRIVFDFGDELYLVLHLMIAGRLHWRPAPAKLGGKLMLAAFDFETGSLTLTEASSKKRASLHVVRGAAELATFDRGGVDVFTSSVAAIAAALRRDNHTIKRALTDPTVLSGIGNAYSDEILHRAKLSPFKQTGKLTDAELERLVAAARAVLSEWIERLRRETKDGFPEKVTAFREGMAVHGRYGQPCPVCGSPVQRIRYADNEANYCATCQNAGRLFADRSLSQLLKRDWPKTLDELEELRRRARGEPAPRRR